MKNRCETGTDAVKLVMDRHYSGQQHFFEDVLAQSISEEPDYWVITIYLRTIFHDVTMTTYQIDKKTNEITPCTVWRS